MTDGGWGEMTRVPGGHIVMGSDRFYPEEAPARVVAVGPFLIDRMPVTNAAFARFVGETGYVTLAEVAPDPADYPGMPHDLAHPGSLTFAAPSEEVDLQSPAAWWRFTIGADWRHPAGPGSTIADLQDHPVVHVALADAQAYASWAGKQLPTEAEWECAARGGLEGLDYAWGTELAPGGAVMANYWVGRFPVGNCADDECAGTSPVGAFPANGFGLHDMIGNVWEWTGDIWSIPGAGRPQVAKCCVTRPPQEPDLGDFAVSRRSEPQSHVLKGGSHLCAENYCRRYRPAARIPQSPDSATSHIGFRCVSRP